MKNKIFKIMFIFLLSFIIISCSDEFGYVETYPFEIEQQEFVNVILEFQKEHLILQLPDSVTKSWNGEKIQGSNMYIFFFYYEKKKIIIQAIISPNIDSIRTSKEYKFTNLELFNCRNYNSNDPYNESKWQWKRINKDLDDVTNREVITFFEKNIVNPLRIQLKNKKK